MNGSEIPTNPAMAIGIFSWSDILSVLVEKNSSGSFSRVSFSGASSPLNKPMLSGDDARGADVEATERAREAPGAKAVATAAKARTARMERIMVSGGAKQVQGKRGGRRLRGAGGRGWKASVSH
ncbi:hypothetical protein ACHAXT_005915 [Thalassiosira profunda]